MTRPVPLRKVVRGLSGDTLAVGPDWTGVEAAVVELYETEETSTDGNATRAAIILTDRGLDRLITALQAIQKQRRTRSKKP